MSPTSPPTSVPLIRMNCRSLPTRQLEPLRRHVRIPRRHGPRDQVRDLIPVLFGRARDLIGEELVQLGAELRVVEQGITRR